MEIRIDVDEREISDQLSRMTTNKLKPLINKMVKEAIRERIVADLESFNMEKYRDEIYGTIKNYILEEVAKHVSLSVFGTPYYETNYKSIRDERQAFIDGGNAMFMYLADGCEIDLQRLREEVLDKAANKISRRLGNKVRLDKKTREELAGLIVEELGEEA